MNVTRKIMSVLIAATMLAAVPLDAMAANAFQNSDFVETEQPELNEETKALIALYQNSPTEEAYLSLRSAVIENYNAVLERKEAKLEELRAETAGKPGGADKVAEMEEIVQEMYVTYWSRINSTMLRFTDARLLDWKVADASLHEFIPVMGAGESVYIKRTTVTNVEYATFIDATGYQAPVNWVGGTYPDGEGGLPVNFVSYEDAEAYCAWLTAQDGVNAYRLPNESEWELAAGHMPKDAEFNCGVFDGRTPVEQYEGITRGAHGAIDFWGNVWEWTSTERSGADGSSTMAVKGGSWRSERTECRTEYRKEGRDASAGYEDVGFRVILVKNGEEPDQKVELATLDAPIVTVASVTSSSITIAWQSVEGALSYQLFEYCEDTGLLRMLDVVQGTSATMDGLEMGSVHSYIVQPVSCTEVADNVSAAYRITSTCENGVSSGFADVVSDAYYAEAVAWAAQRGVACGTSATTFNPEDPCTRAQAVTFLWRLAGSPEPSVDECPFTDVPDDAYYRTAVLWAAERGIAFGTGNATFSPDDLATRAQVVTFQWRAAGSPAANGSGFIDVAADAYYAPAVQWAAESGVACGTSPTAFAPDDFCTRAQAVTFLHRFSACFEGDSSFLK